MTSAVSHATPVRAARRAIRIDMGWILSKLLLAVLFLLVVFPVYYGIVGSVMSRADMNAFPTSLWPKSGLSFVNFEHALKAIPLATQYLNSTIVALVVVAGQLTTSILAAYALVFLPLAGRKTWFIILISTMMIPWEAIIIPNYLTIASLGLLNTIVAIFLPALANGFGIFLMRQAFLSFPTDLRDASRIDGLGDWGFLWRILIPLTRPSIAALAIWSFLGAWNMYLWPLLVSRSPEMQTIQIGLAQLNGTDANDPGMVLAGAMLALLPTLLITVFCQRFIVRGLTTGTGK
jgi:sn-glycerol 3-phosphate transport system permease protein